MRPARVWAAFALCVVSLVLALVWMSLRLLANERAGALEAALQERTRLALWRMDTAMAPIIAGETARPYFVYLPFFPAARAYEDMFDPASEGPDALAPSPLLAPPPAPILLHFQVRPDRAIVSPQAPTGAARALALQNGAAPESIDRATTLLADFAATVAPNLPGEGPVTSDFAVYIDTPPGEQVEADALAAANTNDAASRERFNRELQSQVVTQGSSTREMLAQRSRREPDAPASAIRAADEHADAAEASRAGADLPTETATASPDRSAPTAHEFEESAMRPVWAGRELVLVRSVRVKGQIYLQGAWLDLPDVRRRLLGAVADLLPNASLDPTSGGVAMRPDRMLASAPFELIPGEVPSSAAGASRLAMPLAVAWAAALGAGGAAAWLLHAVLSLSERRATFVSTVTHELRSPLTSIRLYADLLAEGAIDDEAKQSRALRTMAQEASRLSRLLENVLAFARLERGRKPPPAPSISVADMLRRIEASARERAEQAGMLLVIDAPSGAESIRFRADPDSAEQIIFNLIDNSCKYAAGANDPRVHLQVETTPSRVLLRVRDYGPGISRNDARRLFRPFARAFIGPTRGTSGVGLGLALSRRMARAMGADLRLDRSTGEGATFVFSARLS